MKPQHVQFLPWNDPWRGNFDLTDDGDRSCELDDWPMGRWPNKMYFFISGPLVWQKRWFFVPLFTVHRDVGASQILQNTKIYIKNLVPFSNGLEFPVFFQPTAKGQPGKTTHGTSHPNHPFPNQLKAYRQRRKCGAFGLRRSEVGWLMAKDLLVNHDE